MKEGFRGQKSNVCLGFYMKGTSVSQERAERNRWRKARFEEDWCFIAWHSLPRLNHRMLVKRKIARQE